MSETSSLLQSQTIAANHSPGNQNITTNLLYCLLFTVGTVVYFILPVWGGIYSEIFGFSSSQVGWLLSADMITNALANFSALYWINKCNWRTTGVGLVLLAVVANFLCVGVDNFSELMLWRLLAGFAGGALTSIAVVGIGRSNAPDRYFGISLSVQVLFGGLLLIASPFLLETQGVSSIYVALALISLLVLPFYKILPRVAPVHSVDESEQAAESPQLTKQPLLALAVIYLAIILFFAGFNGVWGFIESMGDEIGIDSSFITTTLSISLLISIIGSLLAAWLGGRVKRLAPIICGTAVIIISMGLLLLQPESWVFFLAVNLFNFSYNFVIPFQCAWVASLDSDGNTLVLLPAVQGVGISIGPVLAGTLINDGSFIIASYIGMALLFTSMAFFYFVNYAVRKLTIADLVD